MSFKKIIIILLSAAIAVVILAAIGCSATWKPSQIPGLGETAADFQLLDLEGNNVSLSEFQGRPVLLNFWATWCTPCRVEMPLLEAIHNDSRWQHEEMVILAVDIGEKESTVKDFVEEYGISFTVLLDTERYVFRQYFVNGVPTTYFIDRRGIIQAITVGAFSGTEEIEKNLDKIIPRS